ncbi:hypothetical protein LOTGIDRAFT_173262 [Lottia gigantea]|uniref:Sushi domain-containing protein n=1 Tax=Lottia gigantea TaxID=225164 RepID=V4A8V0_LOTGI|nr:hypothetical protein LOTGIDRAFT_173262 [Lottia gigantea]ESP00359.1 hypothetical protein LOTGIDRAFT_173262 [Lottia gigantea]
MVKIYFGGTASSCALIKKKLRKVENAMVHSVECPQGENITLSDDVTESGIVVEFFNFSCSVGFVETGTLGCEENGTWTEQKACQVELNVVVNGYKLGDFFANNCSEECAIRPECGFTPSSSGICQLYRKHLHRFNQSTSFPMHPKM